MKVSTTSFGIDDGIGDELFREPETARNTLTYYLHFFVINKCKTFIFCATNYAPTWTKTTGILNCNIKVKCDTVINEMYDDA